MERVDAEVTVTTLLTRRITWPGKWV